MDEIIQKVANILQKKLNPDAIILVGSYACGKAQPDSDVDLLLITENPKRFQFEFQTVKFDIGGVSLSMWKAFKKGKLINRNLPWLSASKIVHGKVLTKRSDVMLEDIENLNKTTHLTLHSWSYLVADLSQGWHFLSRAGQCISDNLLQYYIMKVITTILTANAALAGNVTYHLLTEEQCQSYTTFVLKLEKAQMIKKLEEDCLSVLNKCIAKMMVS